MRGELLIAAGPGEWRAAWLEEGIAAELYVERGLSSPAGSILLGRVVRLALSLDAALIDIGEERLGFLPVRASERPEEGARIVVQIRREAQNGKGAYLTPHRDGPARMSQPADPQPPIRLAPAPGFAAALAARLPATPERILASDAAILAGTRRAFPDAELLHAPPETWPLDIDTLFDAALSSTAAFSGGGTMHVEQTRAGAMIDIDTGTPENGSAARTMRAANLAAVAAIGRQLRLRQIGGAVVVDFAAAEGKGLRDQISTAMRDTLAGDPAKPQVLGWTRLGHFEIVRPRRARPLADIMLDPETRAETDLTLAFKALRALYREARAQPAANWRLTVGSGIAAALRGPAASALVALEARLGRSISLETRPAAALAPFDIGAL
ncbi:MAG: ribonuclease E/G [Alphaproteobacteria bacterium]|nr:ribonuclease E/G [Alphaproteobacteria bacterium]